MHDDDGQPGMTLRDILHTIWQRRILLEIAAVVAVVVGLAISALQGFQYKAQAQVLLAQPSTAAPGDTGVATQQKLNLLAQNYARVVATPEFVNSSTATARISTGDASVAGDVAPNTSIVKITVRSSSRSRAVAVANAVADAFRQSIDRQQTAVPADLKMTTALLERPHGHFSSANPVFIVFAALVAGLALAATIALLIEMK